jgi:hypothetical protein
VEAACREEKMANISKLAKPTKKLTAGKKLEKKQTLTVVFNKVINRTPPVA